jgi:hypothetical protein
MFIQGDLQAVFDALFHIGAIDPLLKMDWDGLCREMENDPTTVYKVVQLINECDGDRERLVQKFNLMDERLRNFAALEVARELCEFQERQTLH